MELDEGGKILEETEEEGTMIRIYCMGKKNIYFHLFPKNKNKQKE